jgi:hypothetical protein
MVVAALVMALTAVGGFSRAALADSEDVAMFYDDLSQHGQWAEYENYGAVWRPTEVPQDWRPYTDGRWAPTNDGYVFESQEPWAWATYHYGNWMPTSNGWVWVPGRTWYPSTVDWRTTPETAPVDESYVGWAPTPPPNYVPAQGYAPPSYYPGSPVADTMTSPLWIFAKVAEFLLGLGQPYTPAYSYMTTGILVPPAYVPVFYPQTVIVRNYYAPAYYPAGFMGARRFGFAAYNWGPPAGYVTRFGRYNSTVFNRTINYNSVNITRIHNVVPSAAVLNRHGYVRQIIPPALAQGRPLPRSRPIQDVRMAQANLYKPNILPPPRQVPRINAQFARLQPAAVTPGHGLPGTALPSRALMPMTPNMERQIQGLPPQQRFTPAPSYRPAAATQPGQPQPGFQPRPGQAQPGIPPQMGRVQPGAPARPGQVQPGGPPPAGRFQPAPQTQRGGGRPGEFQPGMARPGAAPPGPPITPRAVQPGTAPVSPSSRGVTPEPRRQQGLEQQRLPYSGPGRPQPQPAQPERLRQQQLQQQQRQLQERQQQGQQERLRQQQMQQQQPRQQPMQQERLRQQQIQQQQMRERQPQQQQQIQQQRMQQDRRSQQLQQQQQQQQQLRQQQMQQQQMRQQQQIRQQAPARPQPQASPRVQPQPRPQPQATPRPQPQPKKEEPKRPGQP